MSLFPMSGLGLQFTRFTVVNVILDLLKDLWPPKALVDCGQGVVDTRVSVLIVKLRESLKAIFFSLQYFSDLLSILSVKGSILKVMGGGLAFDSSSVNCMVRQFIRLKILAQERDIGG